MGFVSRSLIVLVGVFIFYVLVSVLHEGGLGVFGASFYTELGCYAFVAAIFLDTTFSFHKW